MRPRERSVFVWLVGDSATALATLALTMVVSVVVQLLLDVTADDVTVDGLAVP